jgi:hypothetical protein
MTLGSRSPWEYLRKNKNSFHHGPGGYLKSKNNFSASAKSGLFWLLLTVMLFKQVLFLVVSFLGATKVVQSSGRLGRDEAVVGGSR